jgi:hypothetical protein
MLDGIDKTKSQGPGRAETGKGFMRPMTPGLILILRRVGNYKYNGLCAEVFPGTVSEREIWAMRLIERQDAQRTWPRNRYETAEEESKGYPIVNNKRVACWGGVKIDYTNHASAWRVPTCWTGIMRRKTPKASTRFDAWRGKLDGGLWMDEAD